MMLEHLATMRDVALILLAIEFLVLAAIPMVALFYITKALGQLLPRVGPGLRAVHHYVARGAVLMDRAMGIIRAPFEWLGAGRSAARRRLPRRVGGVRGGRTL